MEKGRTFGNDAQCMRKDIQADNTPARAPGLQRRHGWHWGQKGLTYLLFLYWLLCVTQQYSDFLPTHLSIIPITYWQYQYSAETGGLMAVLWEVKIFMINVALWFFQRDRDWCRLCITETFWVLVGMSSGIWKMPWMKTELNRATAKQPDPSISGDNQDAEFIGQKIVQ